MDAHSASEMKLKELLYRAETERLRLQHQVVDQSQHSHELEQDQNHLKERQKRLQADLACQQGLYKQSQEQLASLTTTHSHVQQQLAQALVEYRANDVIALNLRDQIYDLKQHLEKLRSKYAQQEARFSNIQHDYDELSAQKQDTQQALQALQGEHQDLQRVCEMHRQQLAAAHLELDETSKRWQSEHGDLAEGVQLAQAAKRESEIKVQQLEQELEVQKLGLAKSDRCCRELEGEIDCIREAVMVLGKVVERQGAGPLPSHGDTVWQLPGPLGGVQHALSVITKHTKDQDSKLKQYAVEIDRLMDRVRSEAAQKVELQEGLFEARALYASVVSDREAMEARTARAEAERAAAENHYSRAKEQIAEDSSRIKELQDNVLSLTKQVQALLPLQPRVTMAEAERESLTHRVERLQEQYNLAQRQLEQAAGREAELRVGLEGYKQEHAQLLANNTQLLEQNQALKKKSQGMEVSLREGALLQEQLEATKRKLETTSANVGNMASSHIQTLRKLETAKAIIEGLDAASAASGSPPLSSRRGALSPHKGNSRPSTSHSHREGEAGEMVGSRLSPRKGALQVHPEHGVGSSCSGNLGITDSGVGSASVSRTGGVTNSRGPDVLDLVRESSPAASHEGGMEDYWDNGLLPEEVAQLLEEHGLQKEMFGKQRAWNQIKVAMLSQHAGTLRSKLAAQTERAEELEVALLQQEVEALEHMTEREQQLAHMVEQLREEIAQEMMAALQWMQLEGEVSTPGSCSRGSSAGGAPTFSTLRSLPKSSSGSVLITSSNRSRPLSNSGSVASPSRDEKGSVQVMAVADGTLKLAGLASSLIAKVQHLAKAHAVHQEKKAARKDKEVQSDAPLQHEWLRFIQELPPGPPAHAMNHKAVIEAVVRIYIRGVHEMEQQLLLGTHHGEGAISSISRGRLLAETVAAGGSSAALFEVLMAHYAGNQSRSSGHRLQQATSTGSSRAATAAVAGYQPSFWQDTQGPVARLIMSCKLYAVRDLKVAMFCRLCGAFGEQQFWGPEPWLYLLLVLLALKSLLGGQWKGLLRGWGSLAGAKLPLQCVMDLLGNIYNVQAPTELGLLPDFASTRPASSTSTAATGGAADSSNSSHPSSLITAGFSGASPAAAMWPVLSSAVGGPGAVLQQLLVPGPTGPAVDLDQLLAMLLQEHVAGHIPEHPLLHPRRLTDGALFNTMNAWGSTTASLPRTPNDQLGPERPDSGVSRGYSRGYETDRLGSPISFATEVEGSRPAPGLLPRLKTADTSTSVRSVAHGTTGPGCASVRSSLPTVHSSKKGP